MTRPVSDRDSTAWWQALCEHRLLLQRCTDCGAPRWPPRALCNRCGSFGWSWEQAGGAGSVVSWTVSHRSFQPGRDAPYVVVLVRLAEADNLILPGGWDGSTDADLVVGGAVEVSFVDYPAAGSEKGFTLLSWRPTRA